MTKLPFDEEKFCIICKKCQRLNGPIHHNNFTFMKFDHKIYIKGLNKLICDYTINYYLSGPWNSYLNDTIDELYKILINKDERRKIEEEETLSRMFPKKD